MVCRPEHSLPTVERISGRADFAALRRSGRRARSGPLQLVRASPADHGRPAVAYAISRRVGTAVVRNRLRRQLRAILHDAAVHDALPAGRYLVVVAPSAAGADVTTLRGHMSRALTQLSVDDPADRVAHGSTDALGVG